MPLLKPEHREGADLSRGYVDILQRDLEQPGLVGDLMQAGPVSRIYERWWRPGLGRVAKGLTGPGMAEEKRIARLLMGLGRATGCSTLRVARGTSHATSRGPSVTRAWPPGSTDHARCSNGRYRKRWTRASTISPSCTRTRHRFRFVDASFDAVCCFAALNLFAEPFEALDEMRRVLSPGGRIALFTSCRPATGALRAVETSALRHRRESGCSTGTRSSRRCASAGSTMCASASAV